jgi:integrase
MCLLFCHDCKITGLDSWLSGVESFLRNNALPQLPRHSVFKRCRKGLDNIFGQVDVRAPATPLTETDLRRIYDALDQTSELHMEFWVGCLLGFQALLRANEFCKGRMRICDLRATPAGVRISIPFSKRDLTPAALALVRRRDALCPLAAVVKLISFKKNPTARTALIAQSYNGFNSMLKRFCATVGITTPGISSHSLRRGGATALFHAGVPAPLIMAHGRWKSMAWLEYIEFDFEHQHVPTAMLLARARGLV